MSIIKLINDKKIVELVKYTILRKNHKEIIMDYKQGYDAVFFIVSTAIGVLIIATLIFSYTSNLEYKAGYAQGVLDTLKINTNNSLENKQIKDNN
jgi:hypothetical protein